MILKMKPVCDCGHIFKRFEVKRNCGNDDFVNTIRPYHVDPLVCPECGECIEGISMQNCHNVDDSYMFKYDEELYEFELNL